MSGSSDDGAYSRTSSTESTVGSTHANDGFARMPGDRGLADRATGLGRPEEVERLGLLEVVEHVVAVAVRAVVAGREHGVERDLARERVGGVRAHARSTRPRRCARAARAANVSPGSCSRTLKTVCSVAIGRSSIDRLPSSTQPIAGPSATPSSRTLPSVAQRDERLPQRVVDDRFDARVVQLQQVDVIGAEPRQRRVDLAAHRLRSPVVRALATARVRALGLDVVADLRREHDVVARGEVVAQDRLARAVVAVDGRGVEEVDPRVERGLDHVVRIVGAAPPVGDERPGAEPDLGDDEIALTQTALTHGREAS